MYCSDPQCLAMPCLAIEGVGNSKQRNRRIHSEDSARSNRAFGSVTSTVDSAVGGRFDASQFTGLKPLETNNAKSSHCINIITCLLPVTIETFLNPFTAEEKKVRAPLASALFAPGLSHKVCEICHGNRNCR